MSPTIGRILLIIGMVIGSGAVPARSRTDRPEIWDVQLGMAVTSLPAGFVDLACGANGAAPSRSLKSFAEFATCPSDKRGLYEVYFRYDDEREYLAKALELPAAIERFQGTQAYGFPIVASVLVDRLGVVKGIRVVSDPRYPELRPRYEHWSLGTVLMQRFGSQRWMCTDLPLENGESPVGTYFVKDRCTSVSEIGYMKVERRYFHRKGQFFINPHTEQPQPNAYESSARFELFAQD